MKFICTALLYLRLYFFVFVTEQKSETKLEKIILSFWETAHLPLA